MSRIVRFINIILGIISLCVAGMGLTIIIDPGARYGFLWMLLWVLLSVILGLLGLCLISRAMTLEAKK